MPRILLIMPSATYRAEDFVRAASALGAEVVVASEHRFALADVMEDRSLVVDLGRAEVSAEKILAFARRKPLDAVIGVDDQGVELAAHASAKLGLPHNPPGAVAATTNKASMRRALEAAGVAQPAWRLLGPGEQPGRVANEVGWPCVIKPLSLSASRGVIRADHAAQAEAASARARAIVAEGQPGHEQPLLIERYISGEEVAVEGLLRRGRLQVLAIFDKPDPLEGPYFEETIYVTPSRKDNTTLERVTEATAAAATAVGLTEGPIHAELRINEQGAWLIEIAARSIGGLCSRALRFGVGMSLEQVLLRHALGLPLEDLRPAAAAAGVMMLPVPTEGTLEDVRGRQEALAVPGIEGLAITIGPGRPVRPLPEGDRYLGFLFAAGDTPREVERALRSAHSSLHIAIKKAPKHNRAKLTSPR